MEMRRPMSCVGSRKADMARFLIAAMESSGHRARYVRWVIESDVMRTAEVVLSGPRSLLDHQELLALRGRFVAQEVSIDKATAAVLAGTSFVGLLRKQLKYRSMYAHAVRRAKLCGDVDLVILPAADDALEAWAFLGTGFGSTPWVGITMRPAFHLGSMSDVIAPSRRDDWVRTQLYRKLLRDKTLNKLLTIDPAMMEFASSSFTPAERDRLAYLPDPSPECDPPARIASRAELGIPDAARLVLLYGSLTARKGVSQLIHAASAAQCPRSIHVLLAGRQDDQVKRMLQDTGAEALSASGRLHILDKYLDNRLEGVVLSAADFMWLGYWKFYGMSSVLVLGVRHGLPCIFTREGVVGYLGRKFAVGPEIDLGNSQTVIKALDSLANNPQQYDQALGEAKQRFAVHSIKHFQAIISMAAAGAMSSRCASE
jgi:glycosyltransferase involved in cell wall biosynthesis